MNHAQLDDPQVFIPDLIANHARFQPGKEAFAWMAALSVRDEVRDDFSGSG